MKLLLHVCCAPCLIYPLQVVRQKSCEVVGLFYNPNIHPFAEYQRRKQAVEESVGRSLSLEVLFPYYAPQEFFHAVHAAEATPERCYRCWTLRLRRTAQVAKELGYDSFSSTLLVSPYQDHGALKGIGETVAQDEGVAFYYEDFRPGFREAHTRAHAEGLYCQQYCGCIYSEIERYEQRREKNERPR